LGAIRRRDRRPAERSGAITEPGLISAYLDALAARLRFDPSLAQRVRDEVDGHLREAVAADDSGDTREAERRAIERFGDVEAIASQLALQSLVRQGDRVATALVLMLGAIFLVMRARVEWYAMTRWTLGEELRAIAGLVATLDGHVFRLSLVVGIAAWAYLRSRRSFATSLPAYRPRLRRFTGLCAVAAAGLTLSVLADGVLTVLRLLGATPSAAALVPVATMLVEGACAAALTARVLRMMRRMAGAGVAEPLVQRR
jgi:hypothetical protein